MTDIVISRRALLVAAGAGAASAVLPDLAGGQGAPQPVMARPIPVSGEPLPIVGIGSAVIFEYENDPAKQAERKAVIETLIAGGGKLIDTAPAYGHAEIRLGEIIAELGARDRLFIATKVPARESRDRQAASMKASQQRMRTEKFDLMQAWNVNDANFDLGLLREWKAQGICRYTGITSSFDRDYAAIEQVLKREKPDFFQINYSLGDRDAEARLLPAAKDAGCAVLTNLPFGRASMFKKVAGKPLPDWAAEIDAASWAQIFLKFLLSHPAVTAVIPGTDKPQYMTDNLAAGRGRLPDAALRQRIADYWATL
jgi:aryl-alcohol dehydrogenase-like predicted oxidoreductase